jgi:3-hydroxybutyryl-CoA dehydrogenase
LKKCTPTTRSGRVVAAAASLMTGMEEVLVARMVLGCAHPLGPLALTDLIGLDTTRAIAESLYAEFREPQYVPPPLLSRMVEAGLLGRKSGRGFHTYDAPPHRAESAPAGAAGPA